MVRSVQLRCGVGKLLVYVCGSLYPSLCKDGICVGRVLALRAGVFGSVSTLPMFVEPRLSHLGYERWDTSISCVV